MYLQAMFIWTQIFYDVHLKSDVVGICFFLYKIAASPLAQVLVQPRLSEQPVQFGYMIIINICIHEIYFVLRGRTD